MKQTKTISVIIPVYNAAEEIGRCLASLKQQTLKPEQIIVVDDGSTDKTLEKIKEFKLTLLRQKHQGPALARNFGAQKARGEILVFVDADMSFTPDFLAKLTAPIRSGQAQGTWSADEMVANWSNVWARCWNYNQGRRRPQMIARKRGQRKVFRAILKSEFNRVKGFEPIGYTDDWTLVDKLGYSPAITQAKFFHQNPDRLIKVFSQARWIGKRPYKFGRLGTLIAVFRANAAFSVIIGLSKAIVYLEPRFLIFKLVYDLGILIGALTSLSGTRY
jgi:glycosyltransferase involved in cell wall biosynthesis